MCADATDECMGNARHESHCVGLLCFVSSHVSLQAKAKYPVPSVADLCKQVGEGNVVGVHERLLAGWNVNIHDTVRAPPRRRCCLKVTCSTSMHVHICTSYLAVTTVVQLVSPSSLLPNILCV